MSKRNEKYDNLLIKLNDLKRNISLGPNGVNQKQLSTDLNQLIQTSETELTQMSECMNQLKNIRQEYDQQLTQLSPLLSQISPLLDKYESLTKLDKLLNKLSKIKTIHKNLESMVNNCRTNKEFESKVVSISHSFNQLVNEWTLFDEIHKNDLIKDYLFDIIMFWKQILLEKFKNKFIETFESVEWPLISGQLKSHPNVESINTFQLYFNALLVIDIDRKVVSKREQIAENQNPLSETIILPMDLMLIPLKKRFQYHFMETKSKLNRPEKVFLLSFLNSLNYHF